MYSYYNNVNNRFYLGPVDVFFFRQGELSVLSGLNIHASSTVITYPRNLIFSTKFWQISDVSIFVQLTSVWVLVLHNVSHKQTDLKFCELYFYLNLFHLQSSLYPTSKLLPLQLILHLIIYWRDLPSRMRFILYLKSLLKRFNFSGRFVEFHSLTFSCIENVTEFINMNIHKLWMVCEQ